MEQTDLRKPEIQFSTIFAKHLTQKMAVIGLVSQDFYGYTFVLVVMVLAILRRKKKVEISISTVKRINRIFGINFIYCLN